MIFIALAHLLTVVEPAVDEAEIVQVSNAFVASAATEVFTRSSRPERANKYQTNDTTKLGAAVFGIGYAPMVVVSATVIGVTLSTGGLYSGAGGALAGIGIGLLELLPVVGPLVSGVFFLDAGRLSVLSTMFFVAAGVQVAGLGILALSMLAPNTQADIATVKGPSWAPVVKVRVGPGASAAPAGATVSMTF